MYYNYQGVYKLNDVTFEWSERYIKYIYIKPSHFKYIWLHYDLYQYHFLPTSFLNPQFTSDWILRIQWAALRTDTESNFVKILFTPTIYVVSGVSLCVLDVLFVVTEPLSMVNYLRRSIRGSILEDLILKPDFISLQGSSTLSYQYLTFIVFKVKRCFKVWAGPQTSTLLPSYLAYVS